MAWLSPLLKAILILIGLALLAALGLLGVLSMFGSKSSSAPSPDAFWELTRELRGTVRLSAAAPQATVTVRIASSYQLDAFRFQRPDLTVVPFQHSRSQRDPLCIAGTSGGYPNGLFYCPPIGHSECVASTDYPPAPGQPTTQDGSHLVFLCIPNGSAQPDIRVEALHLETQRKVEPAPFDRGLVQYVNWLYGYSLAGAATQPVGNYLSTFRVTVTATDSTKGERGIAWRALANIRGMWGTPTAAPPDARLEITELK